MESIALLIFLTNSILFPLSLLWILIRTRKNKKITALSYYVTISSNASEGFEVIIFLGNFIQMLFSIYLFVAKNFPAYILLGALAGAAGIIVSLVRIDKQFKAHISLTVFSLIFYTMGILLTSLSLQNGLLISLGIAQLLSMTIGILAKIKMKYLEVVYFILFGIWNILILFNFV